VSEITIEEAYAKWADELMGYATSLVGTHDAADVVADTFTHLLEREQHHWAQVREPRGFLFRCVLNTARMRARSTHRRRKREHDDSRTRPSNAPAVSLLSDPKVVRALGSLSLQQRAVIYLTYWDDLAPTQVAETLGIGTGSVKRQLARARTRLRKVL